MARWLALGCALFALWMERPLFAIFPLLFSAWEILFSPRKALHLFSFWFAVPLATLLAWRISSYLPLAALALALQLRLYLLHKAGLAEIAAKKLAKDLRASLPASATLFVDTDIETQSPTATIEEGHLIRIQAGENLPTDGQITFGSSFVDESLLSGDVEPKAKSMGSFVYAGSRNKNGSFIYKTTRKANQSFVMQMAAALESPPPFPRGVFFLEGLLLLSLPLAFWGTSFFSLFLVASATGFFAVYRLQYFLFIKKSAQNGIYWRNLEAINNVAQVGTVVSSPMGVLTEGRFRFSAAQGFSLSEDGILRLLGPLARRLETEEAYAILQEMQARGIRLEMLEDFSLSPGGASGIVDGEKIRWTNEETARQEQLLIPPEAEPFLQKHRGENIQLLFRQDKCAAVFSLVDRVHPSTQQGLDLLREKNIPYVVVTPKPAACIHALEIPLPHLHSDCNQEETVSLLQKLHTEGLTPLWVAAPPEALSTNHTMLSPAAYSLPKADVLSLQFHLTAVAKVIALAKSYEPYEKWNGFLFWIFSQVALLVLAFWSSTLDPKFALILLTVAGVLPGFMMAHSSQKQGL